MSDTPPPPFPPSYRTREVPFTSTFRFHNPSSSTPSLQGHFTLQRQSLRPFGPPASHALNTTYSGPRRTDHFILPILTLHSGSPWLVMPFPIHPTFSTLPFFQPEEGTLVSPQASLQITHHTHYQCVLSLPLALDLQPYTRKGLLRINDKGHCFYLYLPHVAAQPTPLRPTSAPTPDQFDSLVAP